MINQLTIEEKQEFQKFLIDEISFRNKMFGSIKYSLPNMSTLQLYNICLLCNIDYKPKSIKIRER
jgi:hypothetical protein